MILCVASFFLSEAVGRITSDREFRVNLQSKANLFEISCFSWIFTRCDTKLWQVTAPKISVKVFFFCWICVSKWAFFEMKMDSRVCRKIFAENRTNIWLADLISLGIPPIREEAVVHLHSSYATDLEQFKAWRVMQWFWPEKGKRWKMGWLKQINYEVEKFYRAKLLCCVSVLPS